jgi:hypothetical protein
MNFKTDLSQSIVDAGVLPHLVLCLQEPETTLRRVAASSLSDIAKHSAQVRLFSTLFLENASFTKKDA